MNDWAKGIGDWITKNFGLVGNSNWQRDDSGKMREVTPTPQQQYQVLPTATETPKAQYTPTPTPKNSSIPGFKTWSPPTDLSNLVLAAATKYNIPPAFIAGIIQNESGFNPKATVNAINPNTGKPIVARGIAQYTTDAYPDITDEQAYDPNFIVPFLANELSQKFKKYNSWEQVIASHFVGPDRVGKGEGRDERGLGPKGRIYLNSFIKNLTPEMLQQYNFLPQYSE